MCVSLVAHIIRRNKHIRPSRAFLPPDLKRLASTTDRTTSIRTPKDSSRGNSIIQSNLIQQATPDTKDWGTIILSAEKFGGDWVDVPKMERFRPSAATGSIWGEIAL